MDCGVVSNDVLHWLGIFNIIVSGVSLAWAVGLTILYEKGVAVSQDVRIGFGVLYLVAILFGIYVIINIYGRYVKACSELEDHKSAANQTFTGVTVISMVLTILLLGYIGYFLIYKVTTVATTHVHSEVEDIPDE